MMNGHSALIRRIIEWESRRREGWRKEEGIPSFSCPHHFPALLYIHPPPPKRLARVLVTYERDTAHSNHFSPSLDLLTRTTKITENLKAGKK